MMQRSMSVQRSNMYGQRSTNMSGPKPRSGLVCLALLRGGDDKGLGGSGKSQKSQNSQTSKNSQNSRRPPLNNFVSRDDSIDEADDLFSFFPKSRVSDFINNATHWDAAKNSKDDDSFHSVFPDNGGDDGKDRSKEYTSNRAVNDASRLRKRVASAASSIGTSHVQIREHLMQQRSTLEQERTHTFRALSTALTRASEMETRFLWSLVSLVLPGGAQPQEHTGPDHHPSSSASPATSTAPTPSGPHDS